MIAIIVGLIVVLIIIVVVVNAIQQHKEKLEQEKRAKVAKQKAIIDESEELILKLAHLPPNPNIVAILNARSLFAAKKMFELMPESNGIKNRISELESRLAASKDLASNQPRTDDAFILPDNEQQLVGMLQCIKKIRAMLKLEQTKGSLDAQAYMQEDAKFEGMQLKIGVESLVKRGTQAYSKEMLGSARQYFEKALQTLNDHPTPNEYTQKRKVEVEEQLLEITTALKSTNAADRAKKAKDDEDELDMLFQPKKKW